MALVKQVTLPDLYVCKANADINEILFSSMMRVGPIGLFHEFNCDFIIVNIDKSKECNLWKEINQTPLKGGAELLLDLQTKPINMLAGQEFKQPGTSIPNGYFAVDVDSVNWTKYDIVISINFSIPSRIVLAQTNILWCYMLMEPQLYMDKVYFGYDVAFNHHISGMTYFRPGIIDFPYSYIHPELIKSIIEKEIGVKSRNRDIFCDISCSKTKPEEKFVSKKPEHLLKLEETGHNLITHSQNIKENLIKQYHSKYFIKIGGSYIRGNSLLEAISSGCLVIGDPGNIIMNNLLPEKCKVKTVNDAITLINDLESNSEEFLKLYYLQQAMASFLAIIKPTESLINILNYKRKYGKLKPSKFFIIKQFIKKSL